MGWLRGERIGGVFREEVREEMSKIRASPRSTKNDQRLLKLLAEEKQLRDGRDEDLKSCRELEVKLTEMLRTTYGSTAG